MAIAPTEAPENRTADLFATREIGERISMAVASDNTLGIAIHIDVLDDLQYCESTDVGATFTCTRVDGSGAINAGGYPALAFDNQDRPVILHHFCGVDDPCSNGTDRAMLTWRNLDGTWGIREIDNNGLTKSGIYNALVIDPATNEPTMVFQRLRTSFSAVVVVQGTFL